MLVANKAVVDVPDKKVDMALWVKAE